MVAPRIAFVIVASCVYRVGCDGGASPSPSPCSESASDSGTDAGSSDAGGSDAGFPPSSNLQDPLDGGVLGPWWIGDFASGTSVAVDGGYLALFPAANAAGTTEAYIYSAGLYDFTGSSVSVEVTRMLNTTTTAYAWMGVVAATNPAKDRIEMYQSNGILSFRYWIDGGVMDNAPLTYDPVQQLYWRMREADGTCYWETSADGGSFTVQFQMPMPLPETGAVQLVLGAGTYQPVAQPGEVDFENLNILP